MKSFPQSLIRSSLVVSSLAFSACTGSVSRPVDGVAIETPEMWQAAGRGDSGKISTGWLDDFSDSQMRSLVDEALDRNPELGANAAQVRAALESYRVSQSALGPQLDIGASGSRNRSASRSGDSNEDSFDELDNRAGGSRYRNNFSDSLTASWEIDLWGRLADQRDASYFSYEAQLADFRNARLSLAASVARFYIQLISAEQLVQLNEMTVKSFQKNLNIIERNYKAGVPGVRALDVQFGRSNVSAAERSLRVQVQARDEARRDLERVLGRYPSAALRGGDTLPEMRDNVPPGLPANLIERRPDVTADRLELLASAKTADASRKSLLPTLRLTGNTGINNSEIAQLLEPDFLSSAVGANVGQFLYDGGRRKAQARQSVATNQAALDRYVGTCLTAFQEVENFLAAEHYLAEQERFLIQEVAQVTLAEEQAERDYTEGVDGADILSLLEAQRRAFNARSSYIRLRANRLVNRINLHLALGGDF